MNEQDRQRLRQMGFRVTRKHERDCTEWRCPVDGCDAGWRYPNRSKPTPGVFLAMLDHKRSHGGRRDSD